MLSKGGFSSSTPAPEPDFTAGAATMEAAVRNEQNRSPPQMSSSAMPQRVRPSIPQKKTHIDEMFRLKKELDEMRESRDEAVDMKDLMAEDLLTAQEEVQEKDEELRRKSTEVWTWRNKAEKLSTQITEEKQFTAEARESLRKMSMETQTMAASGRYGEGGREAEQTRMRQRIEQLTTALAERDARIIEKASMATGSEDARRQLRFDSKMKEMEDQWRSQLTEEQQWRRAAEGDLRSTRDHYEKRLRETEETAKNQLAEQQKRVQETETALQEQMNRMVVESTSQQQTQQLQHLQQLIVTYEAEITDQRQRCNQFKKTSERLTTQIKQTVASKRNLEQSDHVMRQRLEDMKSQIAAFRLQLRENNMPGSFR